MPGQTETRTHNRTHPSPDFSDKSHSVESKGHREPEKTPIFDKVPKIKSLPPNLTICAHYDDVINLIDNNDISLLVCATGTGKTIGTPLMLLKAHPDARIVITQPRNAPMEEIASYTAKLAGTKVGELVGVRYKDSGKKWDEQKTQIMIEMEQTLENEIDEDPLLLKYNIVHLDEIHENSERANRLFVKVHKAQKMRKSKGLEPLKIVLTTATVDTAATSKKMGNATSYEIERSEPPKHIEKKYRTERVEIRNAPAEAAKEVKNIIDGKKEKSDILVFLPGHQEIKKFFRELDILGVGEDKYSRLTLSSRSTEDDKAEINHRQDDRDRIIVATPSGETGYSFPSPLKYEVDSGLIKQATIDPDTGLKYMETILHSWSGLMQRDGRLGRSEDGEARHLYTKEQFDQQEKTYKYTTPEIRRMSLIKPVLDLLEGGDSPEDMLNFPESPDPNELDRAMKSLYMLGALKEDGSLNEIGHEMANIDIDDPHLARMVVEGKKTGNVDAASTIAVMIDNFEGLFMGGRETGEIIKSFQDKTSRSDYMTLLTIWKQISEHENDLNWLEKHNINMEVYNTISKKRREFMKVSTGEKPWDPNTVGKLVLVAFADQIMEKNPDNTYNFLRSARPTHIHIDNSSAASGSGADFVIMGSLRKIDGVLSAENILPINPEWVKELTPWLLSQKQIDPHFDKSSGKIVATNDIMLGIKTIDQSFIPVDEKTASTVFASALAKGEVEGIDVIDKNNKVIQRATPEETEKNKEKLENLYKSHLNHISSVEELKAALSENPEFAHILQIHPNDLKSPETHSPIQSHTTTTITSSPTNSHSEHRKESFSQRAEQKIEQTWNKFVNFLKNLRNLFRRPPPTPIPAH